MGGRRRRRDSQQPRAAAGVAGGGGGDDGVGGGRRAEDGGGGSVKQGGSVKRRWGAVGQAGGDAAMGDGCSDPGGVCERLPMPARTWAPSVNVPERVSELGAPDGYTAVLAA